VQRLYLQRIPAPPVDSFVLCLWYCQTPPGPHALERVLPNGAAQLVINLKEDQTRAYDPSRGFACETTSGMVISGLQSRYCVIDAAETECVAGVVFRPGGTVPFFRLPAHELHDATVPLEFLWGRMARRLRERLLAAPTPQAALDTMESGLREAFRPADPHAVVAFALEAFQRQPEQASIGRVTSRIGLSPKRFIERFKATVGAPPKQYCRLLRFQRAIACAARGRTPDWTRIAMDCGYFDQAHFIHDFRSFAGITPGGYEAGRTEFANHVKILQSAATRA